MRKADFAIGIYILAAIVFLIVPMKSSLLDVLLALNISIAMIVLFNALFSQEVHHLALYDDLPHLAKCVVDKTDFDYRGSGSCCDTVWRVCGQGRPCGWHDCLYYFSNCPVSSNKQRFGARIRGNSEIYARRNARKTDGN